MVKPISNILVPVDFSENTEVAISKALEFCPAAITKCTIHLYHVQRIVLHGYSYLLTKTLAGYTQQQVNDDIKKSQDLLEQLKINIQKERDINVLCWVSFGETVQEGIIKKAKQLSVDLIVIGKHSHHTVLPFLNTVIPSKLALCSRVPVLTAKPGSFHQEIKTIVVPVGNNFPEAKLEILSMLAMRSRPNIRLVIFDEKGLEQPRTKQLLLYTFRAFKSRFTNPIYYDTLEGGNKARSLLAYCNKIGADVLIVYPEIETKVDNWTNVNISDLLPAHSKTQILAVTPW